MIGRCETCQLYHSSSPLPTLRLDLFSFGEQFIADNVRRIQACSDKDSCYYGQCQSTVALTLYYECVVSCCLVFWATAEVVAPVSTAHLAIMFALVMLPLPLPLLLLLLSPLHLHANAKAKVLAGGHGHGHVPLPFLLYIHHVIILFSNSKLTNWTHIDFLSFGTLFLDFSAHHRSSYRAIHECLKMVIVS